MRQSAAATERMRAKIVRPRELKKRLEVDLAGVTSVVFSIVNISVQQRRGNVNLWNRGWAEWGLVELGGFDGFECVVELDETR